MLQQSQRISGSPCRRHCTGLARHQQTSGTLDIRVLVGVELFAESSVRFLDFALRGILLQAQQLHETVSLRT